MNERQKEILRKTLYFKDKQFKTLIAYSSRIAMYEYTDEWKESDIDGPLYLYLAEGMNPHKIIIFNRKEKNHFIYNLDLCKFNVEDNFIIFENKDRIFGVWFYDQKDFIEMEKIIEKIIRMTKMTQELCDTIKKFQLMQ